MKNEKNAAPDCPHCRAEMGPVWAAQREMKLAAWLCPDCGRPEAAVGREHMLDYDYWHQEQPPRHGSSQ